jgi:DNA-binding NtrC family response regulator
MMSHWIFKAGVDNMNQAVTALLIHDGPETLSTLILALERQRINTTVARTIFELSDILARKQPPQVIFTDRELPDGTWKEVLALAAESPAPTNVVVVDRIVDMKFYIEVIERGAFDFIAPPFSDPDISHVVHCAADNAMSRRDALAHAPQVA